MKSKFSPKFTIVTPYPMMFSEEDLKCVELEIIDTLVSDEETYSKKLSESSGNLIDDGIRILAELISLQRAQDSEWLQQKKQELENIWKIEPTQDQDTAQPSTVDPIFPRD